MNKKKKKLKPPKSGGKKEAQTINKELFGTLNKTENNFFFKRWKTLTSGNTTKPPPEKITHTQRYSLHNTAEHALPKDSIRQYRISNSYHSWSVFVQNSERPWPESQTQSTEPLSTFVDPRQPISLPRKPLSLIRRSHLSLWGSGLLFIF